MVWENVSSGVTESTFSERLSNEPCLKMGQYLDLRCLRKHVERRDRIDRKSVLQLFEVTRKSRRIARHVNQCFRREIAYRLANSFGESRCRWIDDQSGRGD